MVVVGIAYFSRDFALHNWFVQFTPNTHTPVNPLFSDSQVLHVSCQEKLGKYRKIGRFWIIHLNILVVITTTDLFIFLIHVDFWKILLYLFVRSFLMFMSIFPSYSFDSFWIAVLYYVVRIIIVSPVFRFWGGLYHFINCATAMIKFLHRPRSYFGGVELLCPKISILKSFNDCTIGFYKPSPPNSSIGGEKKPWLFLFTFSWLLVI